MSIDAPPPGVWPWLVQLGSGRAGYYSYDAIDNNGRPSAERIMPELQEISVGEVLAAEGEEGFTVAALEPERHLVLTALGDSWAGIENDTVLAYELEERGPGRTRLVCRMRVGYAPGPLASPLVSWLVEPGDFVMMRRQLLGIKRRAGASPLDE